MSQHIDDYIQYRVSKSHETFADAKILKENQRWNACMNRLYYACYYMVSALLLKHNIKANTHSGLRAQFGLQFVNRQLISKENGKLFADLMDWRHKGDYGDMFDFQKDDIEPLISKVEIFMIDILKLIENN